MTMKCKIQLRTLKQVSMKLVIRLVLFYLLVVEGIESNPGPQTGSTLGNSSPRGGPSGRGSGCNGRGSIRGSQQDPIDDAFGYTLVRDPTGLSNRVDPLYTIRRASRSQNQPSVRSQPSVSSWLTGSQANRVEPISQIQMRRAIWIQP